MTVKTTYMNGWSLVLYSYLFHSPVISSAMSIEDFDARLDGLNPESVESVIPSIDYGRAWGTERDCVGLG